MRLAIALCRLEVLGLPSDVEISHVGFLSLPQHVRNVVALVSCAQYFSCLLSLSGGRASKDLSRSLMTEVSNSSRNSGSAISMSFLARSASDRPRRSAIPC